MNKMNLFKLEKQEITAFLWILGISLFGLISWFQANTLYVDDYLRIIDGSLGWNHDGRPLATLVITLLQLGKPFTDISPLPQVLAIAIFSLGIIYINRIFKINNLLLLILVGVITILNPYNISLYSYVLDSLTMVLAIFLSILSLYIIVKTQENHSYKETDSKFPFFVGYASSILLLIAGLCLYQTGLVFYFVGVFFYLLLQLCRTKNYLKSIYNFLVLNSVWLLAMILYSIGIKNLYKHEELLLQRSELPEFSQIPKTILSNISISLNLTQSDLGKYEWAFHLLVILVLSITVYHCLLYQDTKRILKDKIISLGLGIIYSFIIFTSVIFPSYILADVSVINSRLYIGFSAIVGFACFFIAEFISDLKLKDGQRLFKYGQYLLIFYYALIALFFINISLTSGNMTHERNLYEERIGMSILRDVEDLSNQYSLPLDKIKISFVNTEEVFRLKPNLLNVNALKKYPRHNDYRHLSPDNFGIVKFQSFGLDLQPINKERFFRDDKDYYQPIKAPILKRQLYNIYLEEDIFVVTFKGKE